MKKVYKVMVQLIDDNGDEVCVATVNKVYKTKGNAAKMVKKINAADIGYAFIAEEEVEE